MSTLGKCAEALLSEDNEVGGNGYIDCDAPLECVTIDTSIDVRKALRAVLTTLAANLDERAVEAATNAVAVEWCNWNNGEPYTKEAPALARAAIAAYLNKITEVG